MTDIHIDLPVRSNIDRRLPALWQAIVDHTQGEEMFWIGEFLLSEITKETGYCGPGATLGRQT